MTRLSRRPVACPTCRPSGTSTSRTTRSRPSETPTPCPPSRRPSDTAAYSNARARINEGKLPAKDAVRVADFVNYFPYDYAAPKNADPVAFHLEMAPCPWKPKHHLLRIGLKAKVIDKDQMPARNLVFLDRHVRVDGVAPNRLPLVQESLRLLVEQLTGRDRVSIVTYAGDAGLRLPPTPGDQKDEDPGRRHRAVGRRVHQRRGRESRPPTTRPCGRSSRTGSTASSWRPTATSTSACRTTPSWSG